MMAKMFANMITMTVRTKDQARDAIKNDPSDQHFRQWLMDWFAEQSANEYLVIMGNCCLLQMTHAECKDKDALHALVKNIVNNGYELDFYPETLSPDEPLVKELSEVRDLARAAVQSASSATLETR